MKNISNITPFSITDILLRRGPNGGHKISPGGHKISSGGHRISLGEQKTHEDWLRRGLDDQTEDCDATRIEPGTLAQSAGEVLDMSRRRVPGSSPTGKMFFVVADFILFSGIS